MRRAAALAACAAVLAACGGGEQADDPDEDTTDTTEVAVADVPAETGSAAWRDEPGFMGRHWEENPSGDSLVLMSDSVTTGEGPNWEANGLLRNQGPAEVPGAEITAVLSGADGEELERASAEVPVASIRPGEPVPFRVVAETAAAEVAEVSWHTSELDVPPASRSFGIDTYWDRPAGDPRPVDTYAYSDPPGEGPHAHVVFGSVHNTGGDVSTARVVGAWVDRHSGRVLWVAEGKVLRPDPGLDLDAAGPLTGDEDFDDLDEPDGTPEADEPTTDAEGLEETETAEGDEAVEGDEAETTGPAEWEPVHVPGEQFADILFVVKPGTAPDLIEAELYIWGMGR